MFHGLDALGHHFDAHGLADIDDRGQQLALRQALSCYYGGDFGTGFRDGYVQRVVAASYRLNARPAVDR